MQQKTSQTVRMDLMRIFLTPPNIWRERITLILVMVVLFTLFFRPLVFTEIDPIQAVFWAALPTLTVSWGWIVLLRSLFRKTEFCKEDPPA